MIQPILKMGDPRLLQVAEPVTDFASRRLQAIIADMLETMRACNGAGLAAPQIGINQRIVIFEVGANPRYPQAGSIPLTVLINPEITPLSPERQADWEGCLSVPGLRGLVSRYQQVRYQGCDASGTQFSRDVSGFHARVVQHECDHLDGILYPQRLDDPRCFGFTEQLFPRDFLTPPALLQAITPLSPVK